MAFGLEGMHYKAISIWLLALLAILLGVYGTRSLVEKDVLGRFLNIGLNPILSALVPAAIAAAGAIASYVLLSLAKEDSVEGLIQIIGLVFIVAVPWFFYAKPVEGVVVFVLVAVGFFSFLGRWHGSHERHRAERFIHMTSDMMLEERELALPAFSFILVSSYLVFCYLGFLYDSGFVVFAGSKAGGYSVLSWNHSGVALSLAALVFAHSTLYYMFMAGVSLFVYEWHHRRTPSFAGSLAGLGDRIDNILPFSLFAAFNQAVDTIGGVRDNTVNPFALPTAVIGGRSSSDAMQVSRRLLSKRVPEAVMDEVFRENGLGFLARSGRLLLIFASFVAYLASQSVVWGLLSLYFAALVFEVAVGTMNTVYTTILFAWAVNDRVEEGGRRLPRGMSEVIARINQVKSRLMEAESRLRSVEGFVLPRV